MRSRAFYRDEPSVGHLADVGKATHAARAAVLLVFAALAVGCTSEAPPPVVEPGPTVHVENGRMAMSAKAEIGGMDEFATAKVFDKAKDKLLGCYTRGLERVSYMAGEVHFKVRVTEAGKTRWAFMRESTLGDRETESCMLEVVKKLSWPKPLGGEGIAEYTVPFDPPSDERQAVAWSSDRLGNAQKPVRAALGKCREESGTKALKATVYVETDGRANSVGISSDDEKGDAAASCVVDAMKGIKFPSPGSFAAKVSVESE